MLPGGGEELFTSEASIASTRALLVVWPNNPDVADNPHLVPSDAAALQPLWDAPCLAAYLRR